MADRSTTATASVLLAALLVLAGCSQEPAMTFEDQIARLARENGREASWVTEGERTWIEIHPAGETFALVVDPASITPGPVNTTRLKPVPPNRPFPPTENTHTFVSAPDPAKNRDHEDN